MKPRRQSFGGQNATSIGNSRAPQPNKLASPQVTVVFRSDFAVSVTSEQLDRLRKDRERFQAEIGAEKTVK